MSEERRFYLRRLVSFTTIIGFVLLAFTGLILFIEPHGRVAYWSDWRLFGLNKDQWDGVHTVSAALFLVAGILHVLYNWSSIKAYLGFRRSGRKLRGREATVALVVCGFCVVGAITAIPPFANLFRLSEQAKQSWETPGQDPQAPFGQADRASVSVLCQRLGLDRQRVLARLHRADIDADGGTKTLREIAAAHHMRPAEVFALMRGDDPILFGNGRSGKGRGINRLAGRIGPESGQPKAAAGPTQRAPADVRPAGAGLGHQRQPPGRGLGINRRGNGGGRGLGLARRGSAPGRGVGRMTLAQACQSVGVTPQRGCQVLAAAGIEARPQQGMRELAARVGMRPGQLLRKISAGN